MACFFLCSGDINSTARSDIAADAAILAFESFENLLVTNLPSLRGVTVMLSEQKSDISCKLMLENPTVPLTKLAKDRLSLSGIRLHAESEGDTAYLVFLLPKGGDDV